ncbi:MAG: endonuclease/exonuclease/phosphatase family protein [Proteiniphilum sp.]|nr:endonuclease/exonuclease/phosphatase family protein [Proteiniphilum sp.]MDD4415981.1 endonuclease/exonuclease/phosphatase family protein [Proteiniphilum sp.]
MRKIYISVFLIFGLLFVAVACEKKYKDIEDPGWNKPKPVNKVVVMSYNVKYCSAINSTVPDVNAVAAVINKIKPDIVLFQELDKNTTRSGKVDQLALLSSKTNMPYTFYSKAIDYQGGESGLGILSKHQLSDPKRYDLPRVDLGPDVYVSYRILQTAVINVNEKKIMIANTHMELTQENRDLQVPEINRILSNSTNPVIIGGDFNAVPGNKTMQSFFDFGFKKTCTTNCLTIPSINPNREIDFILYRPEQKYSVVSHQVIYSQASDHLPIVAVLELK